MDVKHMDASDLKIIFILEEEDDLAIRCGESGREGQGDGAFVLLRGFEVSDNVGMMELAAGVLSVLNGGGCLQLYEGCL